MSVHKDDGHVVSTTGPGGVCFYRWEFGGPLVPLVPDLRAVDRAKFGSFQQTLFFSAGRQRVAGTTSSRGFAAVWDTAAVHTGQAPTFLKLVKLLEGGAACTYSALTPDAQYVVVGSSKGVMRYFDANFRLVGWNDQLAAGAICAVSFAQGVSGPSLADTFASIRSKKALGLSGGELEMPDFVVATSHAYLIHIDASEDDDMPTVVLHGQDAPVVAVAAHPSAETVALVGTSGMLQLWDYQQQTPVVHRRFDGPAVPTALAFSPDGNTLAVGMDSGHVYLLETLGLREVTPSTVFHESRGAVLKIAFAPSGEWFAVVDADRCLNLFQLQPENFQDPWLFVGKYRAHYRPIADLLFATDPASRQERLFTIGTDRVMVEYSLTASSFTAGIQLKQVRRGA